MIRDLVRVTSCKADRTANVGLGERILRGRAKPQGAVNSRAGQPESIRDARTPCRASVKLCWRGIIEAPTMATEVPLDASAVKAHFPFRAEPATQHGALLDPRIVEAKRCPCSVARLVDEGSLNADESASDLRAREGNGARRAKASRQGDIALDVRLVATERAFRSVFRVVPECAAGAVEVASNPRIVEINSAVAQKSVAQVGVSRDACPVAIQSDSIAGKKCACLAGQAAFDICIKK